mmetsp:Transcript_67784/g.182475  ORF Transcript_67784/g.182475 Transcript_67784/m.182475 type:complete len:264 (+) Transcript_67784:87-878(+)
MRQVLGWHSGAISSHGSRLLLQLFERLQRGPAHLFDVPAAARLLESGLEPAQAAGDVSRSRDLLVLHCCILGQRTVLLTPQLAIDARLVIDRLPEKLLVAACLNDGAIAHAQDRVGVADGAKPMRNHYRGPALHQLLQSFLNQVLRRLIQRRRRLIEQQNGGVCEDGPRNADPLFLSARDVLDCAHLRLQAFRKFRSVAQGVPDVRGPARVLDLLSAGLVLAPDADVVPDSHRDEVWLLRDSRNLGPKPLRVQVLHVIAIYAN